MFDMRRREFVTLLGGAAAAWPVRGRAQQPAMPVIGFLRSASFANVSHFVTAFRRGLKEAGFVEGQNVTIEFRSAEDRPDRLPALATDLIRRPVAVIVGDIISAIAAQAATTTVPIVFATGADPVTEGLVASLNRPGGNVTGVVFFNAVLVLLCHKFRCLLRAAQHGQRESVVTRAATNLRRIVAIEFGTWRSGRNGGLSGLITFA